MPHTLKRLLQDGYVLFGRSQICRRCGMRLYCFKRGPEKLWCNQKNALGGREVVYQEHDIWVCNGRRGRRKPASKAA